MALCGGVLTARCSPESKIAENHKHDHDDADDVENVVHELLLRARNGCPVCQKGASAMPGVLPTAYTKTCRCELDELRVS